MLKRYWNRSWFSGIYSAEKYRKIPKFASVISVATCITVYHFVCCIAANDQLIWHAIVLLEKAVSKSLTNFQFKLLLIQLYSKLGELQRYPVIRFQLAGHVNKFRNAAQIFPRVVEHTRHLICSVQYFCHIALLLFAVCGHFFIVKITLIIIHSVQKTRRWTYCSNFINC